MHPQFFSIYLTTSPVMEDLYAKLNQPFTKHEYVNLLFKILILIIVKNFEQIYWPNDIKKIIWTSRCKWHKPSKTADLVQSLAKNDHTNAHLQSSISYFLIGGLHGNSSFQIFDFKSNVWTEGPNLPIPFGHGITCTLNFYHGDFSIIGQKFAFLFSSSQTLSFSVLNQII